MISSCVKTPVACLTSTKSTAAINEEVTFTSCSTDTDQNQFGVYDGTSATGASSSNVVVVGGFDSCTGTSVTLKFTAAGTYTIELTAKNRISGNCDNGTYKSAKASTILIITP